MAPAQLLPIAFPLASGDAFTVQDVPGKGRGLVATRAIPAGMV